MKKWRPSTNCLRKPMNKEVVVERVIYPAIRGQNCPICLNTLHHRRAAVIGACKHAYCVDCIQKWSDLKRNCPLCNAQFDSWFCDISISNRSFRTHQLPPLAAVKTAVYVGGARRPRVMHRARGELRVRTRRTSPFPWRRMFGRPDSVSPHVIAERKLEWRASVYNRCLQAVPIGPENRFEQGNNNCAKERIRRRIEPWIQRELRALLGNLDTSVIVHVATSLLISRQHDVEDDFLAPLRPFLYNNTDTFGHELRELIDNGNI